MKVTYSFLTATLAALFFLAISPMGGRAQTETREKVQTRFLFIFDTSSAMQKRIAGTELQVAALLNKKLGGYLQDGDTIGVWTFSHDLHTGDLPLQRWSEKNAAIVTDNIKTFVERMDYKHSTSFKVLQPYLDSLVAHSPQVIVFIFTDGEDDFYGTPYDQHINAVLEKQRSTLRKAKQPFVLVLCGQRGEYTGANLGMPPGAVGVPVLPPWPDQPAPTNPPPVVVQEKPPVLLPPLIMVGTHPPANPTPTVTAPPQTQVVTPTPAPVVLPQPTSTPTNPPVVEVQNNPPPAALTETPAPIVNRTPDVSPISQAETPLVTTTTIVKATPLPTPPPVTTLAPAPPTITANPETVTPAPAVAATPTTVMATPMTNALMAATANPPVDSGSNRLLIGIGIGLAISATLLGVLLFFRSRRPTTSLISDSMRNK